MSLMVNTVNAETVPINGVNTYSSNQNYQIIFEFSGSDNMLLDMESLHLVFDIRYLLGNGTHLNNNDINENSGEAALALHFENNRYVLNDPRSGNCGIINSIVWEDGRSQILEQVNNYGQQMNKIIGHQLSKDDQLSWGLWKYGVGGGGKSIVQQNVLNADMPQCMRLFTGVSNSRPIPYRVLSGKCKLILNICSPQMVLYGGDFAPYKFGGANNVAPLEGGAKYEIRNLKCVYKNIILDRPAPIPRGGMPYQHYASFNTTLKSSNFQNLYNFNVSRAKSVVNCFIRSDKLNNYNENSYQSSKIQNGAVGPLERDQGVDIFQSLVKKNGVKFPLDFAIDEEPINKNQENDKTNYDTERQYHYMNAYSLVSNLNTTILAPATERYGTFDEWSSPDVGIAPVYGISAVYDSMGGTSNFLGNSNYSQQIISGADGQQANEIFSSVLAEKVLIPTASGVVLQN